MKPAFRKLSLPVSNSFVVKTDDVPIKNPWHYHPEVELVYYHDCRGTRFVGDSVESIKNHDLVLIGTNLPHTSQRDKSYYSENTERRPLSIVIQFLPEFLGKEFLQTYEFHPITGLLGHARRGMLFTGEVARSVGYRLMKLHEKQPAHRILELLELLLELADTEQFTYLSSEGFINIYALLHNSRLNKVYEHSVNHFMEKIPIETVAELANLTPASFCRFFKARTGRTYLEYLTELRVSFACMLLAEDKLNISGVAIESGFQNLSLFNRRFKELKGVSPSEYQSRLTLVE